MAEENRRLRREVSELRKANEVLKAASIFFAKELDQLANRPFGERQSTYPIAGFWISDSGAGVGVIC